MPAMVDLRVLAVAHDRAPLPDRERLDLRAAADHLRVPHLALGTCLRAELYWWGTASDGERALAAFGPLAAHAEFLAGTEAAHRLLRVAAGLESSVVGEPEVLEQVRSAVRQAREAGTLGAELALVATAALRAGRRVREETLLGASRRSLSAAAVAAAANVLGGLAGRTVLLAGAGQAAAGALQGLPAGVRLIVVNRDASRAARLVAGRAGSEIRSLDDFHASLLEADAVITAIRRAEPILSSAALTEVARHRAGRPLIVADLGVPRNIEANVVPPGVTMLDVDTLAAHAGGGPGPDALRAAERIVAEERVRLTRGLRGRRLAAGLAALHREAQRVVDEETAEALGHLQGLTPAEQDLIREMGERLARRLLYPASRLLRAG